MGLQSTKDKNDRYIHYIYINNKIKCEWVKKNNKMSEIIRLKKIQIKNRKHTLYKPK